MCPALNSFRQIWVIKSHIIGLLSKCKTDMFIGICMTEVSHFFMTQLNTDTGLSERCS